MEKDQELVQLKQQLEILGEQKETLRRDYQAVTGDVGLIGRWKLSAVLTNEQEKFIRAMSTIRLEEMKLIAAYQTKNFKMFSNAHIHDSNLSLSENAGKRTSETISRANKVFNENVNDFEQFIYDKIDSLKDNPTYSENPIRLNKAIDRLEKNMEETISDLEESRDRIVKLMKSTGGLDTI